MKKSLEAGKEDESSWGRQQDMRNRPVWWDWSCSLERGSTASYAVPDLLD